MRVVVAVTIMGTEPIGNKAFAKSQSQWGRPVTVTQGDCDCDMANKGYR